AIGAFTTDIARPVDPQAAEALREQTLAGENIYGHPLSIVRKDGRRVELMLSSGRVDLDGEPHLIISALDVTETRQLEQRAQQSERKYQALFETSPEAIAISRRQDGVTLAVNAAWEELTGHRREQAIYRPAGDLGLWRERA